jgi:uncharacterized protein (DUF2147 family)
MRKFVLSGTLLLLAATPALSADPVGEWLVKDGSARIKVVSCPPALWGVISAEVKPGRDEANPDPAQRNRPMLGVPILINMKQSEPNLWTGKIYDARGGSLYDAKMSLSRNDMLEVRGCMGGIFCGGEDWKRVTDTNIPPLPQPQAAPANQPKNGAMAPAKGGAMTKGGAMAKQAPAGAPGQPPLDPVCSNVGSLVPRS